MEVLANIESFKIENVIIIYNSQSASGLIIRSKGKYHVFGINVRKTLDRIYNEATLITPRRLKLINKWILEGLSEFKHIFQEELNIYLPKKVFVNYAYC